MESGSPSSTEKAARRVVKVKRNFKGKLIGVDGKAVSPATAATLQGNRSKETKSEEVASDNNTWREYLEDGEEVSVSLAAERGISKHACGWVGYCYCCCYCGPCRSQSQAQSPLRQQAMN